MPWLGNVSEIILRALFQLGARSGGEEGRLLMATTGKLADELTELHGDLRRGTMDPERTKVTAKEAVGSASWRWRWREGSRRGSYLCRGRDSNPHERFGSLVFETNLSTISAPRRAGSNFSLREVK